MRIRLAIFVCVIVAIAFADVPEIISYQGRLTHETTGEPVVGSHDVTFRMFFTETGDSLLWEETHAVTLDSSAIYKVELGSITPFSVDFADQYWIEIVVDGTVIMSPRYRLGASPYALRANDANRAMTSGIAVRALTADMLDDMGASDGQVLKWNGGDTTWQPEEDLTGAGISGAGTAGQVALWASSDSLSSADIYQDTSGNIGIGSSFSTMKLGIHAIGHNGLEIWAAQPTIRLSKFTPQAWEISSGALAGRLSIYNCETGAYPVVIDSAGNIGLGVSSPLSKLDVGGEINAQEDITTVGEFYTTRHSSPATAIAYGTVFTDGNLLSGTDNVTAEWDSLNHQYEITIEGEIYQYAFYTTVITVCRSSYEAVYTKTGSESGKLIVYMYNLAGDNVQSAFHFVVYKS